MEIIADESVDFGIIKEFRKNDIEVYSISENNSGIDDIEVLKIAVNKKLLLLTEDKDFGELTYRLQHKHTGILLIRLIKVPRNERITTVVNVVIKHFFDLKNKFSVIDERSLRIKA